MAHFAQLRLDFVLLSCAALKTSRNLSFVSLSRSLFYYVHDRRFLRPFRSKIF